MIHHSSQLSPPDAAQISAALSALKIHTPAPHEAVKKTREPYRFFYYVFFERSHGAIREFLQKKKHESCLELWERGKDRWAGERVDRAGGMPLCKRFEVELVPEWRRQCIDYKVRVFEEKSCKMRAAHRNSADAQVIN